MQAQRGSPATIIDRAMTIPRTPPKMFETRSQAWQEVGLLRQISPRVVKRARLEALVLLPVFVGIVLLYDNRVSLFGTTEPAKRAHDGEPAVAAHKILEP